MNPTLRAATYAAALVCASAFPRLIAADSNPGYVDFGKITPAAEGKFVEVDLPEGLIKFAAKLAATEEPQAADLLSNLKHVRINVVELNDANRGEVMGRVQSIRQELASQGWNQVVNVREEPKGDDVQIFAKTRSEEAIEGLVITVVSGSHEVVLVNVVGDIRPEQIATLAERFDIEPLKKIKVAARK